MSYDQTSIIVDDMSVGSSAPIYTWRKGGTSDLDNHLYLMIGSAHDPVDINTNVLIEVDPETKVVTFHNEAKLLNGLSFADNSFNGSSLKDGSVKASKLEPGIVIDGSVSKLTTGRLIDGVEFDGSANVNHYSLCESDGDDKIKIVVCDNFNKVVGSTVYVKFANDNVHPTPVLNVNDTGAENITFCGQPLTKQDLRSGKIYCFVYDGAAYEMLSSVDGNVHQINSSSDGKIYNILLTANDDAKDSNGYSRFVEGVSIDTTTKTLTVERIFSPLFAAGWLEQNTTKSIINGTDQKGIRVSFLKYNANDGIITLNGYSDGLYVTYTSDNIVVNEQDNYTHQINLLDSEGNTTFANTVRATTFKGDLQGTASNALKDSEGNVIASTYATKNESHDEFVHIDGDQMKGNLLLLPVNGETNVMASTVGYVDDQITTNIQQLEDKILGGVGEEYDTLIELLDAIEENRDIIDSLGEIVQGFVKFKEPQTLTSEEQLQARTNIHAFSASGGKLANNGSIEGNTATFNQVKVKKQINLGSNADALLSVSTDNVQLAKKNASGEYTSIALQVEGNDVIAVSPQPKSISDDEIATVKYVNDSIAQTHATDKKTYINVVAASSDEKGCILYFANIKPTNQQTNWKAVIRATVNIPGYPNHLAQFVANLCGVGQSYTYEYVVNHNDDSFRSFEGIVTNLDGLGSYGHVFGISLYQGVHPQDNNYSRTVEVEVIDFDQCHVSLLDNITYQSDISSAAYIGFDSIETRYNGTFHSNDAKLTDRLLQSGLFVEAGSSGVFPHTLVMEDREGKHHSIVTSSSVDTNKLQTSTWLNPEKIYLFDGDTVVSAGTVSKEKDVKYLSGPFDVRYSVNDTGRFTVGSKLYLRALYDENTNLIQLANPWWTTELPTYEDGYVYILIGYMSGDADGYQTSICHLAYENTFYKWANTRFKPFLPIPCLVPQEQEYVRPYIQHPSVARGRIATKQYSRTRINVHDEMSTDYTADASWFGYIDHTVDSTTGQVKSVFSLNVTNPVDELDQTNVTSLGIGYVADTDGSLTPVTFAPTPPNDDVSTQIATTEWADGRLNAFATAIGEAFEEMSDTLAVSYASNDAVTALAARVAELEQSNTYYQEMYEDLQLRYDQIVNDISNTYMTHVDVANEYLSKTEAANLYLTISDASDRYITKVDASTMFMTREQYQSEINSAYSSLM